MKRLVHRLDHTQTLVGRPNLLNKYVAVARRSVSGAGAPQERELSLFLEGEHSYEEEGVEAMELTVDGKPAPTTVVYARRRKSHAGPSGRCTGSKCRQHHQ
jgi:hypothetical protein